ncbi:MAG: TetR family transcriptional regulator [Clostridia bacterium]|jgi:AcrR family transcriptional regulator|nr:TetR family transcriptional regulator [Clostridia bacterium]
MRGNVDRRIMRTKKAIREALITLIEEKGFDALSVKDITSRANINRGTFYLHYKDKYDLLDRTVEEVIHDIESILLEITTLADIDVVNGKPPLSIVVKLFDYFKANAPLMQAILTTKGNNALQIPIKKTMWHHLFEKNRAPFLKKEKLLVPAEYLIFYIAAAHFGVIQEWLDRGCREAPEVMAKILTNITFGGPLFAAGLGSNRY